MPVPLTVDGTTFQFPVQYDNNWAPAVTGWATAVTNVLTAFPTTGVLTLSPYPSSFINFANATNTGYLPLTINGANQLTFNGVILATSGANVNPGTTNELAYYSGSTTISGLTAITPNRALESNASGLPVASGVSSTTLAYLDATSSIQTQLNTNASAASAAQSTANAALPEAGGTMSGNIAMGTHSITGLANGVNPQDAVTVSQLGALAPSGSIIMYGGASAPSGWLLCDGTSYSTSTYASLFAIIGYTFGGSGSSFRVPNFVNNVPIGAGSIAALGATAGSQTHVISGSELPTHNHTINISDPGHVHTQYTSNNTGGGKGYFEASNSAGNGDITNVTTASSSTGISATSNNTGSSSAMSLIQPSLGIYFIIKY